MEGLNTTEIGTFLGRFPPFDALSPEELEHVAASAERRSSPAGARFVALSLRDRLVRTGHTVHALPELATVRIGELIARPPRFCRGEIAIRTAARMMTEDDSSAILVRDGERLHILTDADLRAKVVAGELSAENPVSRVTNPAVVVGPDRLAVDAVVDMLSNGVDHLVVVEPRTREV